MSRCPSCGGIINRDCFNPIECAQITQNLKYQDNSENAFFYKNEIDGLNLDIAELRYENARLMEANAVEAMDFAEIIGYNYDYKGDGKWQFRGTNYKTYTTSELYQIFLTSKNK